MFIEFGNEILNFYFIEFQIHYHSKELNCTFSKFQESKTSTLTEQNLAKISVQMGLIDKIKISIKPNSPLKDLPKIQAQAIKAIVGAHYFDKNENLNKLKEILKPLYQELTGLCSPNGTTDDDEKQILKQQNFKGDFLEFLYKNKEYYYKVIQEEIKEGNDITYTYEILLNDRFPVKKVGKNKKDVEREAFQDALKLVNMPIFQSIIKSKVSNKSFQLETEINISNDKQEYFQFKDFDKTNSDLSKSDWGKIIDKILLEY